VVSTDRPVGPVTRVTAGCEAQSAILAVVLPVYPNPLVRQAPTKLLAGPWKARVERSAPTSSVRWLMTFVDESRPATPENIGARPIESADYKRPREPAEPAYSIEKGRLALERTQAAQDEEKPIIAGGGVPLRKQWPSDLRKKEPR
jgi:hypothetical protein